MSLFSDDVSTKNLEAAMIAAFPNSQRIRPPGWPRTIGWVNINQFNGYSGCVTWHLEFPSSDEIPHGRSYSSWALKPSIP
jgi:hypothetical protein